MPSNRKLDQDAVRAARDFLLGQTPGRDRTPNRKGHAGPRGGPSRAALTADEPARLVLSAPDIRRTDTGWRARCIHKRGVDSRHVNDARYGGYVGSFMEALEVRDRFYRERRMPIPWQVEAVVDGERVAPEIVRRNQSFVVRWRDEEHEVAGDDAREIATEVALDLFVEFLTGLQTRALEQ